MNKNLYTTLGIVAVVVVIFLLIFWYMKSGTPSGAPSTDSFTPQSSVTDDSIASINESIEAVDLGNLDTEFQEIDSELNNL
jgi:hypothetical protein